MTVHTILFDLDGTLTNPAEGITRSIAHALDHLGVHPPPLHDLTTCIGPPLRVSFPRLLGTSDTGRIERAVALYRERYREIGLFENIMYAEVPDMLRALHGRARLGIATSKPHVYAARILEHFDLRRFFDDVFGAELDGRFDDKRDLLGHVVTTWSLDEPQRVLMVGDREHDVLSARAHGLRTLGVTYGFGSAEELLSAGADALASRPADIVRHADTLL